MMNKVSQVKSDYYAISISDSISESPTSQKIKSFLHLQHGWHCGEGIPPEKSIVNTALEVNKLAEHELLSTDAIPGLDGEVQIVIYESTGEKDKYLEITVEPREDMINVIEYRRKNNQWRIISDNDYISLDMVKSVIKEFGRKIDSCQVSSAYFPKDIISKGSLGLAAWLSRNMETGYQSYKKIVFPKQVPYVTT